LIKINYCYGKLYYDCLEDKEGMINIFYEKRKEGLQRFGIDISLNYFF